MTIYRPLIDGGSLSVRIGWRSIWFWYRAYRAARRSWPHAAVYIGPFPIRSW